MNYYEVGGLVLEMSCDNEGISEKLDAALRRLLVTKPAAPAGSAHISMRMHSDSVVPPDPEGSKEIYASPTFSIRHTEQCCHIIRGKSYLVINLINSTAAGYIDSSFWNETPKEIQEHLVISLLWLMHGHARYALHANCLISHDNQGVLIIGQSGSGKSSTGLSLIRSGWKYLSDDVNLIRAMSRHVEVLAFQRGFSLSPDMACRDRRIQQVMDGSSSNGYKRFLDMELAYPEQAAERAVPEVILFPEITESPVSELVPIDETPAMVLLIENSGGIMVNRMMASRQVAVLKQLLGQVTCYRLLAGRDLYEEQGKLTAMLTEKEGAIHARTVYEGKTP